jgi:hypothetical protein
MSDLIFTGTAEEGERVDITLSSLMNAKWNWPDTSIRTASDIGEVNVLADSIQSADYDVLKAENEKLVNTLNDWSDQYTMVISDKCPSDEHHCACVPTLREEISKLRAALRYYASDNGWFTDKEGYEVAREALGETK